MIKKHYFLLVLLVIPLISYTQKNTKSEADKAYNRLSYLKAAGLYQQLGVDDLDVAAKIRLANSYRLNGDTELAEYWYAQAISKASHTDDLLCYAQVLQSNGKCEKALGWYKHYLKMVGANARLPRASVSDCSEWEFLPKRQVVVTNVQEINSGHLDFSPIPYKGGLVFTSTRGSEASEYEDLWTKDHFSDLFFAKKNTTQTFSTPELLVGEINGAFHDGIATFNKSGTLMYFSRNDEQGKNSRNIVDLKIYRAELQNQLWVNIQELPFNNKEISTCHPALSADGRTLYFASNRMGGFGGMDIYKSVRAGSTWSTPENLGATINTAGNELFPFIDFKNDLYFASNGHEGVGGLDIYVAHKNGENWTKAENMGAPINSSKDDFGFSILENGKEGYFSSNRTGGQGGDDIYHWTISASVNSSQNVITIMDEETGERLPDVIVTVVEGIINEKNISPISGLKVNNDRANYTNYYTRPISLLTDPKGKVQPDVRTGKTYTILVEKAGYSPLKKVVNAYDLLRTSEFIILLNKRKGLSLKGTVIHEKYNHFIPNAHIELFNFCTGEYEKMLSDELGNFEFYLACGCDYELTGNKERFSADKKHYSTINIDCKTAKPINSILYLSVEDMPTKPKPASPKPATNVKPTAIPPVISHAESNAYKVGQIISLENVYYDFNKSYIRNDAARELDHVVNLLKKYPSMEIQLASHTDSRGNSSYNQRLSQKRADEAVNYIISKGISSSRITAKGYGESQPRNGCIDGIRCNEEEHQRNRRTEVKITQLDENVKVQYRGR